MTQTIYRGLEDVLIDTTQVCFIDGDKGELIYRGYDIGELANRAALKRLFICFGTTIYLPRHS
jgi:citrate synthase